MNKEKILSALINNSAVAVVRLESSSESMKVIEAIYNGGVKSIEITMTCQDPIGLISLLNKEMGDMVLVGVGSVLNSEIAQKAIDSGAKYVVSPVLKGEIITTAHKNDVPVIPGAFTPTEIQTAFELGADIIKVFPADILGMSYFKSIRAPMPHLRIMPTGGVTLTNAGEWLRHGACAVGVGSALLEKTALKNRDYKTLENNARILMSSINEYKSNMG